MSMFTSTIDYLLHQRKPVEMDFDRTLTRLRASGNASKLAVMEGNAGALSKQMHMEAENALQVTERNTFQKANTYMQFQEEGIKYANILYSQMATLALRASDPDMSKSERAVLATQFNELREIALDLNYETFTDYYLFDPRSSTTDFSEASNWELYWKRHQAFKPDGEIDIAGAAYGGAFNGFIKDGEAEEEIAEKLYNAPLTIATASGDTQSEGRSITRNVVYNEGIIELAFNTGNLGEIFEIIQGDPNGDHRVLFNSGDFKTKGEANNYDLQYLKFEYGPAMQTTRDAEATPPSTPMLDGSSIPHWIGSPDDFLTQQQDKFGNSLWSEENREFEKANWKPDDLLWQDGKYDWVRDNTTLINALKNDSAEEWEAGKEYLAGEKVKVSTPGDGVKFYEATDTSTGQNPGVIGTAFWKEDLISPAILVSRDLYKHIGAYDVSETADNEDVDIVLNKDGAETRLMGDDFRAAVYRVGGLEFTAKSPDAVGDPNFTFESANQAQFNLSEDSNLLDAQSAIIAYGHAPQEWNDTTTYAASDKVVLDDVIYEAITENTGENPSEDDGTNWKVLDKPRGYLFTPEILFKVNQNYSHPQAEEENKSTYDYSGFDSNQVALILKESEETSFHEGYDPNVDNEDWLNEYSAKITIGGVSAAVTMTKDAGGKFIVKNDFKTGRNLVLGENGNGYEVQVSENTGVADQYSQKEEAGVTSSVLALEKVIKFDASPTEWNNTANYAVGDVVKDAETGDVYRATTANSNSDPTAGTNWEEMLFVKHTESETARLPSLTGGNANVVLGPLTITAEDIGTLGDDHSVKFEKESDFSQFAFDGGAFWSVPELVPGNEGGITNANQPTDAIKFIQGDSNGWGSTGNGFSIRIVEQTKEVQATDADGNLRFEGDGFTKIMETVPIDSGDDEWGSDWSADGKTLTITIGDAVANRDEIVALINAEDVFDVVGAPTFTDDTSNERNSETIDIKLSNGVDYYKTSTLDGAGKTHLIFHVREGKAGDSSPADSTHFLNKSENLKAFKADIEEADAFDSANIDDSKALKFEEGTLSGGESMVVQSKLSGATGNETILIINENVAGANSSSEEDSNGDGSKDTLIINLASTAALSNTYITNTINNSTLFEIISDGEAKAGTFYAADGKHSHTLYNYSNQDIAKLINDYFGETDKRNTAVLRDASGGEEQFDFEITEHNPTTSGGRNEELLTYEETAGKDKVEATFTFSRGPQEDYDSDAFDLAEGIKKKDLYEAWDSWMKEQGFGEPTITDKDGNWMEATNDGNELVVSEINEWSKSNFYLQGNKVKVTNTDDSISYYQATQNVQSSTAPDSSPAWVAVADPNFQKAKDATGTIGSTLEGSDGNGLVLTIEEKGVGNVVTLNGATGDFLGHSTEDGGVGVGKELHIVDGQDNFHVYQSSDGQKLFVHINDEVKGDASEYIQKVNEHNQNNLFKLSGNQFEVGVFTAAVDTHYVSGNEATVVVDDIASRQAVLQNEINTHSLLADFEYLAGDISAGAYTLDGGSDISINKKTVNSLEVDVREGHLGVSNQDIIDEINNSYADLFTTNRPFTFESKTYTAEGKEDGGVFSDLTSTNGTTLKEPTNDDRDEEITGVDYGTEGKVYHSYAADDHVHKMENLNAWLGRDQENVTYEEVHQDGSGPEIFIKIRPGETLDPFELADAYYAFINKKYLEKGESEAHQQIDQSYFMAPVVIDPNGMIDKGTTAKQWMLANNGTGTFSMSDQIENIEYEHASETIEKSNEITVRVKSGDRPGSEEEDSFQLWIKYSPPEKKESIEVGADSNLKVEALALGLGLLRDDSKAEISVGELLLEAEASGEYTLRIQTNQSETSYSEDGSKLTLNVESFADYIKDIGGNTFSLTNPGYLDIENIEWSLGDLFISSNNDLNTDDGLADFDYTLKLEEISAWDSSRSYRNGEVVKFTSTDTEKFYKYSPGDSPDSADPESSSDWNTIVLGEATNAFVNGKELIIQAVNLSTVSVDDVVSAINGKITGFSAENRSSSGDGFLDTSATTIGASSYFTTSGNYGGALNLDDAESAQRAFENMTREISDLAEQVDKLTQNMSQVNLAYESSGRQLAIRKDLNLIDTDNILKEETLNLKQIEILREYHMSLLHKVMRVNEDMVRMLVL